jgi:hypothetical protein
MRQFPDDRTRPEYDQANLIAANELLFKTVRNLERQLRNKNQEIAAIESAWLHHQDTALWMEETEDRQIVPRSIVRTYGPTTIRDRKTAEQRGTRLM